MGCGGAEEEAVGKLLRPLKNNTRLRHLSIIAPNRSSMSKFLDKPPTVAVSPIATNRKSSPSSFRAWSMIASVDSSILARSLSDNILQGESGVAGASGFSSQNFLSLSSNHLKDGGYSSTAVLPGENPAEFEESYQALIAERGRSSF
jgi:hypothetical protein